MISKLNPLPKIPYVDGVPTDSTQTSILWIVNGETLDGAKTKTTNEGSLNRDGVAIQKNAVQLETNTVTHTSKINEVIDQVNLISENLAAISDESVIDKLNGVVEDVEVLKVEMTAVQATSASNVLKIQDIEKEIGVWDPATDPKHRTLRKDIIFLKGEIGKYVGFNEDGDVDPSSTGSGMKYKIMTNAQAISIHEGRITKLEDDWVNSDVGHLTDEVTDLRNEMGPKHLATFESVYVRLNGIGTSISGINTELVSINEYIGRTGSGGGSGSISARMTTAEQNIATLTLQINDPTSGVLPRVITLENAVGNSQVPGSIRYDISSMKRDIGDLNMIVGESSDDGLRGEMAQVMADIGTDSQPTSMKGRILNLENTQRDDHQRLVDVESVVGNTSSGLVASNIALGKAVYGDAPNADPFLKDGVQKVSRANQTAIGVNTTGAQTGIYKLISDLTARVAALEGGSGSDLAQRVTDLETGKASHQDVADALIPYITIVEADAKYEPKATPLAFATDLASEGNYRVGDTVTLTVAMSGGVEPYHYQWKKGVTDVGTDSPNFEIATAATTDNGEYSVVVTDSASGTVTSSTLTLTIYPVPTFSTNLSDQTVVEDNDLVFTVVMADGKTPYTFVWYKDDAIIPGETAATLTIVSAKTTDSGVYYVKATDSLGATVESAHATATITVRPPLAFSPDFPATKALNTGENFLLEATVSGGFTPYEYAWKKDGVAHTFPEDPNVESVSFSNVTTADSATWQVTVTDGNGTQITSTACAITVS